MEHRKWKGQSGGGVNPDTAGGCCLGQLLWRREACQVSTQGGNM